MTSPHLPEVIGVQPGRITPCGDTITTTYEGSADTNGHPVNYVHARVVVAAMAAIAKVHAMHTPNVEDFAPYCPVCHAPAPCPTRQETTRAMETRP